MNLPLANIQFRLARICDEKTVLDFISEEIGARVDSFRFQEENAVGCAQVVEYESGYRHLFLLSVPTSVFVNIDVKRLAKRLAATFNTAVLLELSDDKWLLSAPDGTQEITAGEPD